LVAALTAVLTNVPLEYQGIDTEDLRAAIKRDKEKPASRAEIERDAALTNLKILRAAKARNGGKARLLFWAMIFEVFAVAAVGVAVGIVINGLVLAIAVGTVLALGVALYLKVYGFARPREGPIFDLVTAAARTLVPSRTESLPIEASAEQIRDRR
jgi:hypothetical protein